MTNEESNKAEVASGIILPERLAPFWPVLKESEIPFIRIKATPASDVPVTSSKFGGRPYIPVGYSNPVDRDGNLMMLLAQLNFDEMPKLNGYPETGLLQFFIATDDLYGLNFDNPATQERFRIVYHEVALPQKADVDAPYWLYDSAVSDVFPPITAEHNLTFYKEKEWVSPADSRFQQYFGKDFYTFSQEVDDSDDIWSEFHAVCSSSGHKVGGYAYFTQEDPRSRPKSEYSDYVVLLQIDSEGDNIMWGDVGVANFFIHPNNLAERNFSKVMYNWDCS